MKVQILDFSSRSEVKRWDDFVCASGRLYQLTLWAQVLRQAYDFEPLYLFIDDQQEIASVLPLIRVRFSRFKDELVSIPHLEAGGMINTSYCYYYLDYLQTNFPVKTIRVYQFQDPIDNLPANTQEVIMVKDLPGDAGNLISSIKSRSARRNVVEIIKKDYQVRIGNDPDLVNSFYSLYLEKMREFGTPPHHLRFIRTLVECGGDSCRLAVAQEGNQILGAEMFVFTAGVLNRLYMTVPSKFLKLNIGHLLDYRVMEFCLHQGIRQMIFGRCEKDGSNYVFKERFGCRPVPLYLYRFERQRDSYRAVEGKTAKQKYRAFSQIWSKCPSLITDSCGPPIRKWLY